MGYKALITFRTTFKATIHSFHNRDKMVGLGLRRGLVLIATILAAVNVALAHQLRTLQDHNIDIDPLLRQPSLTPDPKLLQIGSHAAISSDLQLCSNLTRDRVFLAFPGSNAADAAVTQALCIGMVNLFNSGVGGGGYALFASHANESDHLALDFRERAPGAAFPDMFRECPDCAKVGGLATAVPGELMGLYTLHKQRGSGLVSWSQLLQPVIELARAGWAIDEVLAAALELYEPYFVQHAQDWAFVLNSTQTGVKKRGDWIQRSALASTLSELAEAGSVRPFYDKESWITKSMVNKLKEYNGIVSLQDFDDYTVRMEKPWQTTIRSGFAFAPDNDLTVLTTAGSSSGPALISALSIFDHLPTCIGGDYLPQSTFELVEIMKWMASARSHLGDYLGPKVPNNIKKILSKSWIQDIVGIINRQNDKFPHLMTLDNYTCYHPTYEINEPHGTTHFSIVDPMGNAVSLTSTINLLFGSLVHDPKTGIVFNNEMDDFAIPGQPNSFELSPSIYNFPEPGKRPLSSAAPTVILNELGYPDLVVGASGGSRITTSILQTIIRVYWYKMPLLEAIAYPRVHHQLLPDVLEIENFSQVGSELLQNLRDMGYTLHEQTPKSVVNAIKNVRAQYHAVSDWWRKRGVSTAF